MASHCMYQNKATYLLSGEAFSLCACKFRRVNSEAAMVRVQLALKENGGWDSDGFIARYAQNTPITH